MSVRGGARSLTGRSRRGVGVGRCLLAKGPLRTLPVAVLDVLAEQGFEVTSSEDEHSVEAFSPGGALDSFGDGVRPWRPNRGLDDPDALCGEDGVEGSGKLCASGTDEEVGGVSDLISPASTSVPAQKRCRLDEEVFRDAGVGAVV